ncbi:hypothetical protein [Xylophilus sp. GOD-11R]|uniref:hypothetical protein n=1 Tax=Xylophilus sp. GOD-11R TaxID=3089814 RepID=UPI00298C83A3|nr:hypothetical protein [Xylophilus sp. GOD-11R]WPB58237.1 hypothetical protein R9X41_06240 [Xylophilus sp. GOD-11R]
MYLVVIAWVYVALMMAVAEATASNGSVLGAVVTFVLYGLLPLSIVLYLLGTPARRRAARRRAAAEDRPVASGKAPDGGGHAPGAAEPGSVAPVREEP